MVQDPVKLGLAAGPGVAGVAFTLPVKNQLAAFRMVNPRGVRIGVVFHPENSRQPRAGGDEGGAPAAHRAGAAPGGGGRRRSRRRCATLLAGDTVDALWLPADPMLLTDETRRFILTETLKAGKPVYAFSASLVARGRAGEQRPRPRFHRRAGGRAGEPAGRRTTKAKIDLQVPRAELVINNKIASKLKIEMPPDALKAASKVL